VDLGRILESEPNDGAASHRLPPVAARTRLEVTGLLSAMADHFGAVDTVDAFRYETLVPQDVALTLDFPPIDPGTSGLNELFVRVEDPDGALLASVGGTTPPLGLAFSTTPGRPVRIELAVEQGHPHWVLRLDASDPVLRLPAALAAAPAPAPAAEAMPERACADTHVLVRLRPGADPRQVAERLGFTVLRQTAAGSWCFGLPEEPSEGAARANRHCQSAATDPDVLAAEPDWFVRTQGVPDDEEYPRQWNLRLVGAPGAWDVSRGSPSVVIGVVDTGSIPHPDLDGQWDPGYDFVSDPGVAGDGGGRDLDPTDPGDFGRLGGISTWHGTHVAAIAAAAGDDAYGVTGVAPGCRLMMLRALGRGGGLVSDVSDAILFAAGLYAPPGRDALAEPLPVLNLSFGMDADTFELQDACQRASEAGVLLVAATGNSGTGNVLAPARYPFVLAVGAVNGRAEPTGYTNYGPEVDLVAPGGRGNADAAHDGWPDGILSCLADDTLPDRPASHGYLSGTSQAAPHVAGAAALLLSIDPTLGVADLTSLLTGSAVDGGAGGRDDVYGFGVLQLHEAVRDLLLRQGTPREDAPRLLLARGGVKLEGLATEETVAVMNVGGQFLDLASTPCLTDDGVPWLSASMQSAPPGSGTRIREITVHVNYAVLPSAPARYAGTVFLHTEDGETSTLRVVTYVQQRPRAGVTLSVAAIEEASGIARALATATADHAYRYVMLTLRPGVYVVRGGEDANGDGFFCQAGDACGWYGGTSHETAAPVLVDLGVTPGIDFDVSEP
jgi:serine protease